MYPNGEILKTSGTFYISGGLALFSAAIVYLFVPPVVPDGMKMLDAEFIEYLAQHGYSASDLGLAEVEPPTPLALEGGAKKEHHDDEKASQGSGSDPDAPRTQVVELKA